MKADGIGNRFIDDIVGQTHRPKHAKNTKMTSVSQTVSNGTHGRVTSIEQIDRIAEDVNTKLEEMSKLLSRIRNEKDDIIREQLIRFFNVLKAYINEALHPTGDWSTDQIISGMTIKINVGTDGASIILQGQRIDNTKIGDLSKLSTTEDIEAMQQKIKKAQDSTKKLLNTIASAKSQTLHQSNKSSTITL